MNFFLSKTLYKYFSWKEREIICYVDRKIRRKRPLLIRIASFFRIKWWWPVDFTNADGFSSYIFISFRWKSSEFMRRNFGMFSVKKKIICLSDVLCHQMLSEYTVWYEETCAGPEQYVNMLSMTKLESDHIYPDCGLIDPLPRLLKNELRKPILLSVSK